MTSLTSRERAKDSFQLLAMSMIPAVGTLFSFYLEIMPHLVYVVSKGLMIALPIMVWRRQGGSVRSILVMAGVTKSNGLVGALSGVLLGGVVAAAYFLLFSDVISPEPIRAKLESLNLANHFWMAAMFIALWNSALEEWFWRGFLLERMQHRFAPLVAVVVNGALFGVHHFFILLPYVQGGLAVFFSLATMIAGSVWAFMRQRGVSLVDCWVSHIFADLAIMMVGWILLQQAMK